MLFDGVGGGGWGCKANGGARAAARVAFGEGRLSAQGGGEGAVPVHCDRTAKGEQLSFISVYILIRRRFVI